MSEIRANGNVELQGVGGRRHHLNVMFRDFVKRKGRVGAARLLGVNYKTVARAHDAGRITDHLAEALEKLLQDREGAEAPTEERTEERFQQLEEDVSDLRETFEFLRAHVEEAVSGGQGRDNFEMVRDSGKDRYRASEAGVRSAVEGETPIHSAVPQVEGLSAKKRWLPKREDPELVTEAPAEDDPEVYGAAWPLVDEWRNLREGHPYQGKSLSWLLTQERLLVLELAMLEEHGLTLPPETQPLRGFGRRGQTRWRHKALHDTRVALQRRKMLRLVRRVLTLGLWWK